MECLGIQLLDALRGASSPKIAKAPFKSCASSMTAPTMESLRGASSRSALPGTKRPSRNGLSDRALYCNVISGPQVFMILRPTLRLATGPFPPADFEARRLAAVILPPLLFFAIV
jgi:hypothetical protein